jgi:hypothetical protein
VISSRDKARYQVWKDEFLSTETGRREWQAHAQDTRLLLTIATSTDNRYGAAIGHYEWNRSGNCPPPRLLLAPAWTREFRSPSTTGAERAQAR